MNKRKEIIDQIKQLCAELKENEQDGEAHLFVSTHTKTAGEEIFQGVTASVYQVSMLVSGSSVVLAEIIKGGIKRSETLKETLYEVQNTTSILPCDCPRCIAKRSVDQNKN